MEAPSRTSGTVATLCAFAICFALPACRKWEEARSADLQQCLLSLTAVFPGRLPEGLHSPDIGPTWTELSGTAAAAVLKMCSRRAECGDWTDDRPLLDPWKQPVHVEVRSEPDGRIGLRLWSAGPDRKPRTPDDVSDAGWGPVFTIEFELFRGPGRAADQRAAVAAK